MGAVGGCPCYKHGLEYISQNRLTQLMENRTTEIAFTVRSTDYLTAAKQLIGAGNEGNLRLRSEDPIDMLIGHSFELSMKATLIGSGINTAEPKKFGHDISELYQF